MERYCATENTNELILGLLKDVLAHLNVKDFSLHQSRCMATFSPVSKDYWNAIIHSFGWHAQWEVNERLFMLVLFFRIKSLFSNKDISKNFDAPDVAHDKNCHLGLASRWPYFF